MVLRKVDNVDIFRDDGRLQTYSLPPSIRFAQSLISFHSPLRIFLDGSSIRPQAVSRFHWTDFPGIDINYGFLRYLLMPETHTSMKLLEN